MKLRLLALCLPLLLTACASRTAPYISAAVEEKTDVMPSETEKTAPAAQANDESVLFYVIEKPLYPECKVSAETRYTLLDKNGTAKIAAQDGFIYPLTAIPNIEKNLTQEEKKLLATLFMSEKKPEQPPSKAQRKKHCLDARTLAKRNRGSSSKIGIINAEGEWLADPFVSKWHPDIDALLLQKLQQLFPGKFQTASEKAQKHQARIQQDAGAAVSLFFPSDKANSAMVYDNAGTQTVGLFDVNGSWLINPQDFKQRAYSRLIPFRNPQNFELWMSVKQQGGKKCYGLVNTKGKDVLPPEFEYFPVDWMNQAGRFPVKTCNGLEKGFVDLQGQWIFKMPLEYSHLDISGPMAPNGWFRVTSKETGYTGMMDSAGKLRIPVRFKKLEPLDNGEYVMVLDDKNLNGVLNAQGEWTLKPQKESIKHLPNSSLLEIAQADAEAQVSSYQYRTLNGQEIAEPFTEKGVELVFGFDKQGYGFARKIDTDRQAMLNQEGFVNEQGEWIIQPEYSFTLLNQDVKPGKKAQKSNETPASSPAKKSGSKVPGSDLQHIRFNEHGLLVAAKNGKKGVIDRQGKTVLPFEYKHISLYSNSIVAKQ